MRDQNNKSLLEKIFLKTWHPYFWIVAVAFIVYAKILTCGFNYLDDNAFILNHQFFLKNISNVFEVFKRGFFLSYQDVYYRPLPILSFMFDAQWSGTSPLGYHMTNVIIHALNSCLLFLFFIKLKYRKDLAFFSSLIFAVHPVLTFAIANIPARTELLLGSFAFASFIAYVDLCERKKLRYFCLHLLFFAMALFTKEVAVVLILLYFLYSQLILRENFFSFRSVKLMIGWAVILLFWSWFRHNALHQFTAFSPSQMLVSLFTYLPAAIQLTGKAVFPFNLSVFPTMRDTTFAYGIISLALLAIGLFLSKQKRWPHIIFGFFWFISFLLLPFIVFSNLEFISEHRLYLPLAGFMIMLFEIDTIKAFNIKNKYYAIVIGLIILILAMITLNYAGNFKDRITFWESAARTSPHSSFVHKNLGAMYYLDGLLDKAESEYKISLKLNPFEPMAHNNLGLIYLDKGMFKESEEEYKKELAINPLYDNAYFNLGLLYARENRLKEAEYLWKKTLEINPDYIDAYKYLIIYYYGKKDLYQTKYYIERLQKRGIQVDPEFLKTLNLK